MAEVVGQSKLMAVPGEAVRLPVAHMVGGERPAPTGLAAVTGACAGPPPLCLAGMLELGTPLHTHTPLSAVVPPRSLPPPSATRAGVQPESACG
jgi:hypothetical protein